MENINATSLSSLVSTNEDSNFTIADDINGPALAVVVGLEFLISLVINSGVLLVTFAQPSSLKKPSTIFLSFLVGDNLIMILFFMPFTVISAATGEWIFGSTDSQKQAVCTFVGFMFSLSVGFSTHTFALISFDRFLFIVKPLVYIKYMNQRLALVIIACLYPVIILLNLTPLFGLGALEFSSRVSSCVPIWSGHTDYVLYFSLVSIIPYSTIIITSLWTIIHMNKFFKRNLEMSLNMTLTEEQKQSRQSAYNYRICNLVGIFGALFTVYTISLIPYVCISVIGIIVDFDIVPNAVYAAVLCFYLLHTITIPQVQAYFRPELRKFFKAFWKKITQCFKKD